MKFLISAKTSKQQSLKFLATCVVIHLARNTYDRTFKTSHVVYIFRQVKDMFMKGVDVDHFSISLSMTTIANCRF